MLAMVPVPAVGGSHPLVQGRQRGRVGDQRTWIVDRLVHDAEPLIRQFGAFLVRQPLLEGEEGELNRSFQSPWFCSAREPKRASLSEARESGASDREEGVTGGNVVREPAHHSMIINTIERPVRW